MKNRIAKLLLTLLVVSLVACGGAEERKARYLQKGEEYLQENNYDKALLEFKNALQIDPKSVEGRYYYGRANEKLGRFKPALAAYTKAVELKPDYHPAIVGVARIYMLAGRANKARENIDKVLSVDAENIDALVVRAGANFLDSKPDLALKDVSAALEINPDHESSLALLAKIYLHQGQDDKAEALIASALQRSSDKQGLRLLLIQIYQSTGNNEAAIVQLQKLIEKHPLEFGFRAQKASLYERLEKRQQAEDELRLAVNQIPESIQAKKTLIQFLAKTRDLMFAQVELASMQKANPDDPELKLIAAQVFSGSKDYDKAEEIYREVIRKYEGSSLAEAQYQLVILLLNTERREQAMTLLNDMLATNSTHIGALELRGRILLSQGDADGAISDFRTLLKQESSATEVMKLLAQAHVLAGQRDLAEQQVKSVLSIKPMDVQARTDLGKLYYQNRQYESAIEQLKLVLQLDPKSFAAYDVLFKSYLKVKDYSQAVAAAKDIKQLKPDTALGDYYHGLVLQDQENYMAAIDQFRAALIIEEDAIEPLSMLVRSAISAKKSALAITELDKIIKNQPDHVVAYNLKGEVLANDKKYAQAIGVFQKAIEIKPDWWIAYRNLAGTYKLSQQFDEAIATYEKGIDLATEKDQLITALADLYEQQNRIADALNFYETMHQRYPESKTVANNLAMLLIEQKDDQGSKDRALSLVSGFADSRNPSMLDTLGWVYYKRGEYDKALTALTQADRIVPNQLIIHYHLGSVYYQRGDSEKARRYLQSVIDAGQHFKWQDQARQMIEQLNQQA